MDMPLGSGEGRSVAENYSRDEVRDRARYLRDSDSQWAEEAFWKWVAYCTGYSPPDEERPSLREVQVRSLAAQLDAVAEGHIGGRDDDQDAWAISSFIEGLFSGAYAPALGKADAYFICGADLSQESEPLFSPPGDEQEEGGASGEGFATAYIRKHPGSRQVKLLFSHRFPISSLAAASRSKPEAALRALYRWILSSPLPSG